MPIIAFQIFFDDEDDKVLTVYKRSFNEKKIKFYVTKLLKSYFR